MVATVTVPDSGRGLTEDFVVGVKGEGRGERSDVGDEGGVLKPRCQGREEGQLAHLTVG